jgi:lysophospholipase L1-like esterase
MAAPQRVEPANLPPAPGITDDTLLRQVIRVSLGGRQIRVRVSNEFGTAPLTVAAAHVARPRAAGGGAAIEPESERVLTFGGRPSVALLPGAAAVSDALAFDLRPVSDLAVTLRLGIPSRDITGHPGSRCTSYLHDGGDPAAADLAGARPVVHWYILSGVDVAAAPGAAAVVTLGDSLTDGRGSPTNGNGRWPDFLARRLQADRGTRGRVAVLNAGIGGNALIRGGLGPSALDRLDRDALTQLGARWLIVFEGINDLGTRSASGDDLIGAYRQIVTRAKARGLKVYGATLLPCGGSSYFTPDLEASRQRVNAWMRAGGNFDAVIDLDAALRDPVDPTRLGARAQSPDHLHPAGRGYQVLADAIDLALFTR